MVRCFQHTFLVLTTLFHSCFGSTLFERVFCLAWNWQVKWTLTSQLKLTAQPQVFAFTVDKLQNISSFLFFIFYFLNWKSAKCELFYILISIEGTVHSEKEICLRAWLDIDEFVSSSEQIWRNLALHHLFINGSSAVNGCRQNESPNSW